MARLAGEDTILCISPSSNLATGAVAHVSAHPLKKLLDAGVRVALSADDPALFATTTSGEYRFAREKFGLDRRHPPDPRGKRVSRRVLLARGARRGTARPSVRLELVGNLSSDRRSCTASRSDLRTSSSSTGSGSKRSCRSRTCGGSMRRRTTPTRACERARLHEHRLVDGGGAAAGEREVRGLPVRAGEPARAQLRSAVVADDRDDDVGQTRGRDRRGDGPARRPGGLTVVGRLERFRAGSRRATPSMRRRHAWRRDARGAARRERPRRPAASPPARRCRKSASLSPAPRRVPRAPERGGCPETDSVSGAGAAAASRLHPESVFS